MAYFVAVFGAVKTIGELTGAFKFPNFNIRDATSDDYLHCDLAPSYGKLNKETCKLMDEHLMTTIAVTMRELKKKREQSGGALSWQQVMEVMSQCSALEEVEGSKVNNADKLIKESKNWFKFDGSPEQGIVREVENWFTKLISDTDVLESTKINIDELAKIVAQTGATVTSIGNLITKTEEHSKDIVDIGVLRFPDIDSPYFKVYRIKIRAWSRCERTLVAQNDKNGIVGEFNARNFKPRASVINNLPKEILVKATKEVVDMFSN